LWKQKYLRYVEENLMPVEKKISNVCWKQKYLVSDARSFSPHSAYEAQDESSALIEWFWAKKGKKI